MYPTLTALNRTSLSLYKSGVWRKPMLYLRLWFAGLQHWRIVSALCRHTGFGNPARIIADDPLLLGILVWPLVDARWSTRRRLQEFKRHYREAAFIGSLLELKPGEVKTILHLDHIHPALAVCLERQPWFDREGQLALSIFQGGERIYTVAFILSHRRGHRVAYVGAVQGVKQAADSEKYKELTKATFGIRPRDLVIAMFLLFCKSMQVSKVLAVRDKNRQHRHAYFGAFAKTPGVANYDEIWQEHGADLSTTGFYLLQPGSRNKDLADIPSKKRATYRRRYAFLDDSQQALDRVVQASVRTQDQRTYEFTSPAPLWERLEHRKPLRQTVREWWRKLHPAMFGSWLWSCPVMF